MISQAKLPSDAHHLTWVIISQYWFRQRLGAVRQQAITWTNVDLDPGRHMASVGHNELTIEWKVYFFGRKYTFTHHNFCSKNYTLRPIINFLNSRTCEAPSTTEKIYIFALSVVIVMQVMRVDQAVYIAKPTSNCFPEIRIANQCELPSARASCD